MNSRYKRSKSVLIFVAVVNNNKNNNSSDWILHNSISGEVIPGIIHFFIRHGQLHLICMLSYCTIDFILEMVVKV